MNRFGELLSRHRNLFLLALLVTTLLVSSRIQRKQLETGPATVDIPMAEAFSQSVSPLEAYRQQREKDTQEDLTALESLCAQSALDERTRQEAAAKIQAIIDSRQMQTALEGALLGSSLSPCVAVVSGDNVTIVTSKTSVTDKDAALVLTLAATHANATPGNVRIITAE